MISCVLFVFGLKYELQQQIYGCVLVGDVVFHQLQHTSTALCSVDLTTACWLHIMWTQCRMLQCLHVQHGMTSCFLWFYTVCYKPMADSVFAK